MATELSAIINDELFKTTTDGLSGTGSLKYDGSTLVWTPDSEALVVYSYLGLNTETVIPVTASTEIDFTATGLWGSGLSKNATQDTTAGSITVLGSGVYKIGAWASISSDALSTSIKIFYSVNGVNGSQTLKATTKNTGETSALSAEGVFQLNTNDVVKLRVVSDKTANLTVESLGFTLLKIDEV